MENKDNLPSYFNSGAISTKVEEQKENLDEHGRAIHEDLINFKLSNHELVFIHEAVRDILSKGLVPDPEVPPVFTLLEMLAERQPNVVKEGFLLLPVNYFVGMWHCLNTGRKFSIYEDRKGKNNRLDSLTKRAAYMIDMYHGVKSDEVKTETAMNTKPSEVNPIPKLSI